MLKRLTVTTLFLILTLSVFMLGVDEAFAAPNPPSSFTVSKVTSNGFKISWSGGPGFGWSAIGHNFRHREKGTTGWTEYGAGNYTNIEFFSLKPATTYEYQVSTHAEVFIVPATKWSGWSSTQEATTNSPPQTQGSMSNRTFKVEADAITMDVSGYFTDPDGDTLTYTTSVANSGANVTVSLSDDTLTLTPGANVGTATVTVTASDVDRSATQTFTVTVEPYYVPQPVGTIPDQTLKVDSSSKINASAYFTHPDGDTMTYSATSSDTAKATVSLSWVNLTISPVAIGTSTITVTVTDSRGATATQSFTVTVEPYYVPQPVGTILDQTLKVGGTDSIISTIAIIHVSDSFSHPDGDTMTYSATSSDTSKATVNIVVSESPSGTLATLTVTAVAAGTSTITVTATDSRSATATQTFTVTVWANSAPVTVGSIPDQSVRVGGTAGTVHVSSYFSDPDGDTMTYSATSSDTSIATAGLLGATLTITGVAAGTATITVTATDPDDATATQTISVQALPNRAPTAVGTIPDQSVRVGSTAATVDVSSYFSDADGNPLTYSATSSDTSRATVSLANSTLTITAVAVGSATITVTATDTSNATGTQTIPVVVSSNRTPTKVGSIPTQTVGVGGTATTVDLSSYFSDPDGNPLTYSATSSNTNRATVSVSGSTLTITAVATGWLTVTVTATDTSNATGTQTFYVNVVSNRAPTRVGTISSQLVRVGSTAGTPDVGPYFSDPDGHTLTYSAISYNTSRATVSVSGSAVTITGVAVGNTTIRVKATDIHNASTTQSFSVKVVASDAVVRVGTISTQTVFADSTAGTVDMSSYFSGPDGVTLTYSATSSSTSRATVTVSGSIVTITGVAVGWSTIRVTATAPSNASATQTFSVRVSNRAPTTVGTIPTQTVRVGGTAATVDVSSYFSDPDGHTLTYSAISYSTSRATVTVSGSTLTITAVGTGSATIRVKATDTSNAYATQTFSVITNVVIAVGTIPEQTVSLSGTTAVPLDVSSYFEGPDGTALTYRATSSDTTKTTVSVSEATVTTTGVAAGSATITVTATTTGNASATQTFSINVVSNLAPIAVGTIPTLNTAQTWNEQFDVSSYFSDPDGNTLTYAASSSDTTIAEAGISVTHSSAVYVFGNGVGTATVTVTATDPSNATATQTFSVTVTAQTADAVPGLSSVELSQLSALLTYRTVIFNELHNGADDTKDWLELRNVSGADLPLDDYQLTVRTGSGQAVIAFPAGTVIPVGEVLLLTNTAGGREQSSLLQEDGEMASADDMSVLSVVSEKFVLPQAPFALMLRNPTVFGDIAGNYVQGEALATIPSLTVDTVWERTQPTVFGYRAEAWVKSTYQNGLGSPGYYPQMPSTDLNSDGVVNIFDLVLVASQFGTTSTTADLNMDGTVNMVDLALVAGALGPAIGAPTAKQSNAAIVNTWLKLARENAANVVVTSIPEGFSYQRGIAMLEALARALTPDTTALLANYPNPFNPETWIPYQLSKSTDVTITIYASDGNIVRTLAIGYQDAGLYKNRSQAAYWDGKNEIGESVASGVYFYTLTAGDFSATRKMLILK